MSLKIKNRQREIGRVESKHCNWVAINGLIQFKVKKTYKDINKLCLFFFLQKNDNNIIKFVLNAISG